MKKSFLYIAVFLGLSYLLFLYITTTEKDRIIRVSGAIHSKVLEGDCLGANIKLLSFNSTLGDYQLNAEETILYNKILDNIADCKQK